MIEEKNNPLLKRKEVLVSIDYDGGSTPSKADLQKSLAKDLGVNLESLEITKVLSETGMSKGKAWLKLWEEKKVPIYTTKKQKTEGEQTEAPAESAETQTKEKPKETEEQTEQSE